MNAPELFRELAALGVHLIAKGDKLRAEGATGALSLQLREAIKERKPELQVLINDPEAQRDKLLSLAGPEGVPTRLVLALDHAALLACIGLPDSLLCGFLRGLVADEHMAKGYQPAGWQTVSECSACGPVWLDKDAPARVIACPWCWHRKRGVTLPRPPVACGGCRHYQPDPVNPEAGIGRCGLTSSRPSNYPMALHECGDFRRASD